MKWRKYLSILLVSVLLISGLCGCGAASDQAQSPAGAPNAMLEEAPAQDALAQSIDTPQSALPENRKWVITVSMHAETENLDGLLEAVFQQAESLGGYVEDQNVHNGSTYETYRYRSARLTVRIPAQKVDEFTAQVEKNANVVSNSRNLEDITLQYVDTETRLKALQIEEDRLLELLEQAQTMSDLLEIEGRLTDVRYEKERITSQLRTYDNQVNYATVYLDMDEVREYTPVEEPTVWERISGGFLDSLQGVGEGFLDFLVWILANSPYLLIWAVIIALTVVLIRKWRKRRKLKKQEITQKENQEKSENKE